jgi:pimeloyl-ACP methyl ester carboxylesterase
MTDKPSILLLAPRFTDQRIWGEFLPELSDRFDAIPCDSLSSPSREVPGTLDIVRDLRPPSSRRFDIVIGAQDACGLAVDIAAAGLADGLALFQPHIDSITVLEEAGPVDFSQLEDYLRIYAPLAEAMNEPIETWRNMAVSAVRDVYIDHLAPDDLSIVCRVSGDYAEQTREELRRTAEDSPGDQPARPSQTPWVDELRSVDVPVMIVSSRDWQPIGRALTARAPAGELMVAEAQTGMLWLEDRETCLAAVTELARRINGS